MATETIRRKGTKDMTTITITRARVDGGEVWIFGHDAIGKITSSIRAPIDKIVISASAKRDVLRVGVFDYPIISAVMGGAITMSNIPIEMRNEIIEHAVGYNGIDESLGQSGFCDMTTCEIEGEE